MDSDVRDLLDGYLRDLTVAYEGLAKAIENHRDEMHPAAAHAILHATDLIIDAVAEGIACEECWMVWCAKWGAGRTPPRVGTMCEHAFSFLCEPCAEKRSTKRDPFSGVITSRSDE